MSRYRITPNYTSESWEATRREVDSMLSRDAGGQECEREKVPDELRILALASRDPDVHEALRAADLEASASPEEARAAREVERIVAEHEDRRFFGRSNC